MPTQETQILDNIIASRRALLMGGGAAFAALGFTKPAAAASTVTTYSDNDILNFALNLEYLEANFYYLAAFGTTIDVSNAASLAAGAPVLAINGVLGSNAAPNTTTGIVANTGYSSATAASYKVPFTSPIIAAYAVETAVEEGKHVSFLRTALNSGTTALAVAQPALNLTAANFLALATAAQVPTSYNFNPYANDALFLLGAYIFEDVGVSAYHGAAPLITGKTTILPAAVGIHAVEAYHAGLVRTSILLNDNNMGISAGLGVGTLTAVTGLISTFRAAKAYAAAPSTAGIEDPNPDDYGVANQSVTLNTTTAVTATQIVDCTPQSFAAPATGFGRTTTQVLNIVTNGNATTTGSIAKGGFFPNGLNGLFI